MSVSQSTPLPKVKQDYKIGTYFVAKDRLYHINYITNDFVLLENCYDNKVITWTMQTFIKAKKRIVHIREEVTV